MSFVKCDLWNVVSIAKRAKDVTVVILQCGQVDQPWHQEGAQWGVPGGQPALTQGPH